MTGVIIYLITALLFLFAMIGDEKLKLAEYGSLKLKLILAILFPFLVITYIGYWVETLGNFIVSKVEK